jgi:hypothetical protein
MTNKSPEKRKGESDNPLIDIIHSKIEKSNILISPEDSRFKGVNPFKSDLLKPRKTTPVLRGSEIDTVTNVEPSLSGGIHHPFRAHLTKPRSATTGSTEVTTPIATTTTKPTPSIADGRIFFEYGLPAANMTVRLYSRGFGGTETMLGESKTDAEGNYKISYEHVDKPANFEVRVVNSQGKEIRFAMAWILRRQLKA